METSKRKKRLSLADRITEQNLKNTPDVEVQKEQNIINDFFSTNWTTEQPNNRTALIR